MGDKKNNIKIKVSIKKNMKPGGGGRFKKMVNSFEKLGKPEKEAKAIAAAIGRKKYGKKKFQLMAIKAKKKNNKGN